MSRTYLVAPAEDPDVLAKALSHGADAVVIDLVAPANEPDTARSVAAGFLATVESGTAIWVRINSGPVGHDDIRELAGPAVRGVFVNRTESPVQLDALDSVLSTVESDVGLGMRSLRVVPSIESATAVLAASAIARAPRVAQLFLAEDEIVTELGLAPGNDERELLWVRSQVVVASAAAGLSAPIACPPSTLGSATPTQSTMELRRLGFGGRACTDGEHVAIVDDVFRPSPAELDAARDVLERWAAATREAATVCRDAAGRVIDETRVRRAQRSLGRS